MKVELTGLEAKPERVLQLFRGFVGSMKSKNENHNSRNTAKQAAAKLVELYPAALEGTKPYLEWKAATGQVSTKEVATAEIEANKPHDLIVSEKHVHLYKSAMRRDKVFNLTHADVKRLMSRKTCYYTGVKLSSDRHDPCYRTVDRIDPEGGYVQGNVVACSHLANQIKNRLFEEPTSVLSTNLSFMKKMIATLEDVEFEGRTDLPS